MELEPLRYRRYYSVISANNELDFKRPTTLKCTDTVHETALGRFIVYLAPHKC